MVTGRTDRLDRLEGLAAGADDFLTKPVDEEELVVRLAIAGRILGVQAELEEKNALSRGDGEPRSPRAPHNSPFIPSS